MGKQLGQSVNSATSPPAPATRRARASSRSNPRAPSTTFAPLACHVLSRGAFPFYALLRGLAYPATCAGDDDNLVFDSGHALLLSAFSLPFSHFICGLSRPKFTFQGLWANSCVRRGITEASYPPVDEKPPTA